MLLFFIFLSASCGQKVYFSDRTGLFQTITVKTDFGHLEFNIGDEKPKLINDLFTFYWFDKYKVVHTKGFCGDRPLNGKYREYNEDARLLTSGMFEDGLKTGEWLSFSGDGSLIESKTFRKGVLHGDQRSYKGESLTMEMEYSNGELLKERYFIGDSIREHKIVKGQPIDTLVKLRKR